MMAVLLEEELWRRVLLVESFSSQHDPCFPDLLCDMIPVAPRRLDFAAVGDPTGSCSFFWVGALSEGWSTD